ncbi:MAG: NADH-quinone oxidoreductase subunit NuoG, partial [Komagataeibacter saccharivorans]
QHEIGGDMRGCISGVRLFPAPDATDHPTRPCATDIPAAFARAEDSVLVLPDTRLFGSEELSMLSPSVAARATPPTLRVPTGAAGPTYMTLHLPDGAHTLPVEPLAGLPDGVVLCPSHMVSPAFMFPCMARITPAGEAT